MTEDWRLTGCQGKVSFQTWKLADDVRKARNRNQADKRQVYRCEFCGCYHLGRPSKKRHGRPKDFQPPESGIT